MEWLQRLRVCCLRGVRFLSSILTSEVNAGFLQICVLSCQLVVKTPVGSQHLSCWLPEGLTTSAVIVQEGVGLTVQQNYIQANLSLHQFSHLSHSGWRHIQEYGYLCYYVSRIPPLCFPCHFSFSATQQWFSCSTPSFFSWGDEETGQARVTFWSKLGTCMLQRERWCQAGHLQLMMWLHSLQYLVDGPSHHTLHWGPPRDQKIAHPVATQQYYHFFFTIQMGQFGSRSNIDAMLSTCRNRKMSVSVPMAPLMST